MCISKFIGKHTCIFASNHYNEFVLIRANPSRGGDAKSWIFQPVAKALEDRQTAKSPFGGLFF
jgi:hypothetical protein